MTTDRREHALGTYLDVTYPWGVYRGGAALCSDGQVRKLKRIAPTADTFFSIPASVTVKGLTVAGYVSVDTVAGFSTPTEGDPTVVRFRSYRYRKNHALLPEPEN